MMPAWVLSFCSGFLSLSLEVLWLRLFSFVNHSTPQSFAIILFLYLIGIAIGAWVGKSYCERKVDLWRISGIYLALATLIALVGPWAFVHVLRTVHQLPIAGLAVALTAAMIAVAFPIAHHLGTPTTGPTVGRSLSKVYVANIIGATLGPIFSGIILLALVTTQQAFLICACLTGVLAICCLLAHWQRIFISALWVVLCGFMFIKLDPTWLIANAADPVGPIGQVVENQYGIVLSYKKEVGGDEIFGGNVYDGRTNLDPIVNSNGLHRILILAALQPKPKKVLVIGLSIGTWLTLINTFPNVERVDVIEINPGYLTLMKKYPRQLQSVHDPRVHLTIDDGRRWLKAHPNNRYDLVVMNNTYHWRVYSANMLSQEFLTLIHNHMNPEAVLAFNTTGSMDALKTASVVFRNAYLYANFVVAADIDWRPVLHEQKSFAVLQQLMLNGKRLFPTGHDKVIHSFLDLPVYSVEQMQKDPKVGTRPFEVVTDRNLITEYKYGLSN